VYGQGRGDMKRAVPVNIVHGMDPPSAIVREMVGSGTVPQTDGSIPDPVPVSATRAIGGNITPVERASASRHSNDALLYVCMQCTFFCTCVLCSIITQWGGPGEMLALCVPRPSSFGASTLVVRSSDW